MGVAADVRAYDLQRDVLNSFRGRCRPWRKGHPGERTPPRCDDAVVCTTDERRAGSMVRQAVLTGNQEASVSELRTMAVVSHCIDAAVHHVAVRRVQARRRAGRDRYHADRSRLEARP